MYFSILKRCLKVLWWCLRVILHVKLIERLNVLPKLILGGVKRIRESKKRVSVLSFIARLNNIDNCCTICTYSIFVRLTASRV